MSILGRMAELLQAKTHQILNRMEDPNEMLDLSYEKMLSGLQETKRHLADVVAEQKSLERQMETARQEATRAEGDARLALQNGREDLARSALGQKQAALQKHDSLNWPMTGSPPRPASSSTTRRSSSSASSSSARRRR